MKNLQENIVPAVNQVKQLVFPHENSGIRILFAGNSITKHSPKPQIGWHNDCGMAASAPEKDYVHLLMQKIWKYDANAAYCIAQVGSYEANLFTASPEQNYRKAAEFQADILIMFFGANVPKSYDTDPNPPKTFGRAYEEMRNFLNAGNHAAVFHSQGFYIRPKLDAEKLAVAAKYGDSFMRLGDIVTRKETHGQFNHPSDLGMKQIAEVFWSHIEPAVRALIIQNGTAQRNF